MKDLKEYNALIVVTPSDYLRLESQYERLIKILPVRKIIFIGNNDVGEYVKASKIGDQIEFINENDVICFDEVHSAMKMAIGSLISAELPRGITGWYYQQFLKLSYSMVCEDDYYMVWDGDTVPTKAFTMFKTETGCPYFDMKSEFHKPYFDTIEKLFPGMYKSIGKSFISEHMIFKKDIVKSMLSDIMSNGSIEGRTYYEKIINAISPKDLMETSFSEFETYGTYVSFKCPDEYALRSWHSIRYGSIYFEKELLTESDYEWISKDFDAISFEKNQEFNQDIALIFKTPEYREKLSARQIIEAIQDSSSEGMREEWDDEENEGGRVGTFEVNENEAESIEPDVSDGDEYLFFNYLGDRLLIENVNQAYLCYENAFFLCPDENIKEALKSKKDDLFLSGKVSVNKTSIVIVSYNSCYLMQQCLNSIRKYCAKDAYEIIVVDNGSNDGVSAYLSSQKDITLVLNEKNVGFPKGCNIGIGHAGKKNDIFLLNNDTRMTHNALFWLRMGLYENAQVGATGSISNYCNLEQRVDVRFAMPDQYVEYGKKVNVYMKKPYEEKNRLCGFALLIKRDALNKAGELDEIFTPGYYEDEDICLKIHALGYQLMLCHNSFIYHAGSQSFAKRSDLEAIFARNHKIMKDRYGYDTFIYSSISEEEYSILERISHGKDDAFSILEIGAGTGNMLGKLKYLYPNSRIYGIEENEVIISDALRGIPILNLDWKNDRLPFGKNSFDYIVLCNRTNEKYDIDLLGEKVKELLKDNGQFIEISIE